MPEHTDFLTRDELAEVVGVHRRTLELWAARGFGPRPIRHGPKLIRYHRGEVQTWLREGDSPGGPAKPGRARSGLTPRPAPDMSEAAPAERDRPRHHLSPLKDLNAHDTHAGRGSAHPGRRRRTAEAVRGRPRAAPAREQRELEELFDRRLDGVAADRRFRAKLRWHVTVFGDGTAGTSAARIFGELLQAERRLQRTREGAR